MQNQLLAALPADVYERLHPDLEPVTLALGEVIYEAHESLSHVYFPTSAIVSLLYTMENGASAEMGVVGHRVYRSPEDPNDITVTHDFSSSDEARAFVTSARLREAMTAAGVLGEPSMWTATPI